MHACSRRFQRRVWGVYCVVQIDGKIRNYCVTNNCGTIFYPFFVIFLKISKIINMTYATIVHELDIVRHKLGERKYGKKRKEK